MNRISVLGLLLVLVATSPARAETYYVDARHAAASDGGPGTQNAPYRTISAAVRQRGGPGTTIIVKSGTYQEQVTVGASGAPGRPFVIEAHGEVALEGSEDFSSAARWTPVAPETWLAASVSWDPNQVIVAGRRLLETAQTTLPSNTFRWEPGTGLLVNAGGGNPGRLGARVGRHDYGFRLVGRSDVTIRGFTVARADVKAFYAHTSSNIRLERNRALWSALAGLHFSATTGGAIEACEAAHNGDHGVFLSMNATGALVRGNRSHHNQRMGSDGAIGFHLFAAPDNRLENNEAFENQDSGFQFTAGSNDVVSVHNRSWRNGDHGFDHVRATGVAHVGCVAWGNTRDGFSFEGDSPGGRVHNSIATDNGAGVSNYDLWVDGTSQTDFRSDFNILWNATGQAPVRWGATVYTSVAAFAEATRNERRAVQADPRFVAPANGNFRLRDDSPAIDAADSGVSHWPEFDADGHARFDVPGVDDAGSGPVRYADRGAYEFRGKESEDLENESGNEMPERVALAGPHPNPSPDAMAFVLDLPERADVTFAVYDLQGREIRRQAGSYPAGRQSFEWDGADASGARVGPGVYYARVSVRGQTIVRRVVRL